MDSEMLEVLIWACIAIVMIYVLYSTLGKRQGFQDPDRWASANKRFEVKETAVAAEEESIQEKREDRAALNLSKTDRVVYEKICNLDPAFSLDAFMKGAESAFSLILESFAKEDRVMLKTLFSHSIFAELEQDIEDRQSAGEVLKTQVLKIHKMEISKLELLDTKARITVEIESEQFHLIYNAKGEIIEGSENQTETLRDLITFERDVCSLDPNWIVIRMEK
ncbi:MAG: Tim44/TimA family putative adaptor protein [Candidatus Nucleicultricaceae bacterium]